MEMLRAVLAQVAEAGWAVEHVDATVMLERPKLAPHRHAIRDSLAAPLGSVNVKFTTGEAMGFVGRGEGAAAFAVATLRPELVTGIALAGGAPTGHAAIVARALGIPLVLGLGDAVDRLARDVEGAVDGSAGRLLIAPTAVMALWPWTLTALTGRAIGAWLIGLGIAAGHAASFVDRTPAIERVVLPVEPTARIGVGASS